MTSCVRNLDIVHGNQTIHLVSTFCYWNSHLSIAYSQQASCYIHVQLEVQICEQYVFSTTCCNKGIHHFFPLLAQV